MFPGVAYADTGATCVIGDPGRSSSLGIAGAVTPAMSFHTPSSRWRRVHERVGGSPSSNSQRDSLTIQPMSPASRASMTRVQSAETYASVLASSSGVIALIASVRAISSSGGRAGQDREATSACRSVLVSRSLRHAASCRSALKLR